MVTEIFGVLTQSYIDQVCKDLKVTDQYAVEALRKHCKSRINSKIRVETFRFAAGEFLSGFEYGRKVKCG
jgi:hypothetical protein